MMHFYSQSSPQDGQVSTDAEVGMNRMITLTLRGATILVRLAPGLGICPAFCNLLASSFLLDLCWVERPSFLLLFAFWSRPEPGIGYQPGTVGPLGST